MNDVVTSLLIFLIVVGVAFFVRHKAGTAGGFGKWLWMAVFGAACAFFVYLIFTFFVHYENPVLKLFMMFVVLAIVTPVAGWIGGAIYDKRK